MCVSSAPSHLLQSPEMQHPWEQSVGCRARKEDEGHPGLGSSPPFLDPLGLLPSAPECLASISLYPALTA